MLRRREFLSANLMQVGRAADTMQYYEAVGPIPRFNQAPKWNDTDDAVKEGEDHVTAHQNQTSRHRQTVLPRLLTARLVHRG